ncbi:MAG: hypothetical protein DRN81_00055 [Thermoproteota archaeon]|nr:MAG: hypothetical protein DRN81_00055 [Candidatus Korarchaeota archaeon]
MIVYILSVDFIIIVKPIWGEPAFIFQYGKCKTLVVADIHLGVSMNYPGNPYRNLVSEAKRLYDSLLLLITKENPRRLLILGDVKHDILPLRGRYRDTLQAFIRALSKLVDVTIIKGNHDAGIEKIAGGHATIIESSGMLMGDYAFLHGHANPSSTLDKASVFIMGHIHPAYRLSVVIDHTVKVWLKMKIDKNKIFSRKNLHGVNEAKLVVMPAFNPYITGFPVNEKHVRERLPACPIVRRGVIKESLVRLYSLDGTLLAKMQAKSL